MKPLGLFNLLLVCAIAVACKKERVCECTTTYSHTYSDTTLSTNQNYYGRTNKTVIRYDHVRKRDFEAMCRSSEYKSESPIATSTSTNVLTQTTNVKCEIK